MPPGRTLSSTALFLSPICCLQAPLQKPAYLFISLGSRSFGLIELIDLLDERISTVAAEARRWESKDLIEPENLCDGACRTVSEDIIESVGFCEGGGLED